VFFEVQALVYDQTKDLTALREVDLILAQQKVVLGKLCTCVEAYKFCFVAITVDYHSPSSSPQGYVFQDQANQ